MLISPAYAQGAAAGDVFGSMTQFLPLVLIFAVFYFLLIRPQQQKQKQMKASLSALKRGDKVVTGGGVLAVVTRPPRSPDDREIEVEIAPNVRMIVLRETISAVIPPQAANDARPARAGQAEAPAPGIGSMLKGLFGRKDG